MRRIVATLMAFLACLAVRALAQGPASLNAGSQVTYNNSSGTYALSWWGVAGDTYLIKTSDDLMNWSYVPIVESGSNAVIQWGFSANTTSLFLELEYISVPPSQLSGAIFNGPDNNGNGLPDDWELFYFGYLGVDPNAFIPWSGGQITNLQAFQEGLNPLDFYNGATPTIAILSGNNQTGAPGGYAPAPLIVLVSDSSANPLTGAPVTFTVTSGASLLKKSFMTPGATPVTLLTNQSGQAAIYLQLTSSTNAATQITATAGPPTSPAQVTFTASTDNGSGSYASPFAPSNVHAVVNRDGSEDMTWQNNTDSPTPILIQFQHRDGTWYTALTLPAGSTSVHIPPQ